MTAPASYEVIIIGLGGMGSATARSLAARGVRVAGFEQFGPAHARGASHGESRVIRLSYFEEPSYVPLLRTSYELWERLERDSPARLLNRCGGLFLGPPDSDVYAGTLLAAEAHDLPHEILDTTELRRRYPMFAPADGERAVLDTMAGWVPPEATVAAHLELARRDGADLHFDTPVQSWSADGEGVAVVTDTGTYRADRLVVSPGAWAPALLHLPDLPLRVERRVQMWFAPTGQLDALAAMPVWLWERGDGLQFYGFPLRDGAVKVALHNVGAPCDPQTVDRSVTALEVEQLRDVLRTSLPVLAGDLVKATVCTYTLTPDGHFILARHPLHPQVTIAAGFSGHGFKFTPVIGEVLADLAMYGSTLHPIALFDPARVAGADFPA